jgi:putative hydrolase of the HAD superfamily
MEHAEAPANSPRFAEISDLSALPETIEKIVSG